MTEPRLRQPQRLHPLSFLFVLGPMLRQAVFPLLALVFLGHQQASWQVISAAITVGFVFWALLRTRTYQYHIAGQELLVREGLLSRTHRHIPLARIHNISQRRKFLHRWLGVTELRLDSAAGGKPEAVMKVLSLDAAAALEAALHAKSMAPATPDAAASPRSEPLLSAVATAANPVPRQASQPIELLHELPIEEILRLGLISNRGTMMALFLWATLLQHNEWRQWALGALQVPIQWIRGFAARALQEQAAWGVALELLLAVLLALLVLRLLSVALAYFKYHDFRLERQGEKLIASHGFGTHVRATARLPRLQRWQLDESWLHRRFGRCKLSVTVAGHVGGASHVLEAGMAFNELAPIATVQKARDLLALCLPHLHWDRLQWQPLQHAMNRRLWSQARWLVPCSAALLWLDARAGWWVATPWIAAALIALGLGLILHARAWASFGAYALAGDVLLYRSGVWHKRWVIVAPSRLQSVRLHSTPLDRRLKLVSLQADTQGGSKHWRALDIPCLAVHDANQLQARIWLAMQQTGLP